MGKYEKLGGWLHPISLLRGGAAAPAGPSQCIHEPLQTVGQLGQPCLVALTHHALPCLVPGQLAPLSFVLTAIVLSV